MHLNKSCKYRLNAKKEGSVVYYICNNPQNYKFKKIVTPLICENCNRQIDDKPKILNDGVIIYPQLTWEPPPLPLGYRRKSNNPQNPDAWVLIPQRAPCFYLKFGHRQIESCGCHQVNLVCTRDNKELNTLCTQCLNWKAKT